MKWNVIQRNTQTGKFRPYNIFEHPGFCLSMEDIFRKQYTKERFLKELDQQIRCFFHANDEGEIFITTWPPYIDAVEISRLISEYHFNHSREQALPEHIDVNVEKWRKIDVYDQLCANWDRFAGYMWGEPEMRMAPKLVWNAYKYSCSTGEFRIFNIFDHNSFYCNVRKLLKLDISKADFAERLRREVQYYYWSKTEWECIITGSQPRIDRKELQRIISECYLQRLNADPPSKRSFVNLLHSDKIDVYDQLCLNWDAFVDYVWSYAKSINSKSK